MNKLIDNDIYTVTCAAYEDEPELTFDAMWSEEEQVFNSDHGWVDLTDVIRIEAKA